MVHPFIDRMALRYAVNAALQRGTPVYRKGASTTSQRLALKETIKVWLALLGQRYVHSEYNPKMYLNEIEELKRVVNAKHSAILNQGMISIGVAQKCIGVYLKYLWLIGDSAKMPHFPPIDGLLMRKVGENNILGFKKIMTSEQLIKIIERVNRYAQEKGYQSATRWEADWWTDKQEDAD